MISLFSVGLGLRNSCRQHHLAGKSYPYNSNCSVHFIIQQVSMKPQSADTVTLKESLFISLLIFLEYHKYLKACGEKPWFTPFEQKITRELSCPAASGSTHRLSPHSLEASSSAAGGLRVPALTPLSVVRAVQISAAASFPPRLLQSTEQLQRCKSSLAEAGRVQPVKDFIY